jgi:hypothetical protein
MRDGVASIPPMRNRPATLGARILSNSARKMKQKNRDCRYGGIPLPKKRSSIPFISRFDGLSHESDRLLGWVFSGAPFAVGP